MADGAFGKDTRSKKQKQKEREQLRQDRTGGRGDKSSEQQFKDLQQSNRRKSSRFYIR